MSLLRHNVFETMNDEDVSNLLVSLQQTQYGKELLKKYNNQIFLNKILIRLIKEYEKEWTNSERNIRGFEALGRKK